MNVRIKSPNLAALRAAVFTLSAKNLRGGGVKRPPPAGNRVNPRPAGGGRLNAPPFRFFRDSEKTAARSAAKFGTPYLASVPHILCKNQPQVI